MYHVLSLKDRDLYMKDRVIDEKDRQLAEKDLQLAVAASEANEKSQRLLMHDAQKISQDHNVTCLKQVVSGMEERRSQKMAVIS